MFAPDDDPSCQAAKSYLYLVRSQCGDRIASHFPRPRCRDFGFVSRMRNPFVPHSEFWPLAQRYFCDSACHGNMGGSPDLQRRNIARLACGRVRGDGYDTTAAILWISIQVAAVVLNKIESDMLVSQDRRLQWYSPCRYSRMLLGVVPDRMLRGDVVHHEC